jgi:hypothetical protein
MRRRGHVSFQRVVTAICRIRSCICVSFWHLGSGRTQRARLCLLLGDIQTEYAFCELGNFYSAGRVDRRCTAAGVMPPIERHRERRDDRAQDRNT